MSRAFKTGWIAAAVLAPLLTAAAPDADAPPAASGPAAKHKTHAPKLALATGVSFDKHGRLWRVSIDGDYLVVRHSDDKGARFSAPVRVNTAPEKIAADGDNRPKIVVADNGTVYVSYTQHLSKPYSGHVRLSRSTDGGRSFRAPLTVNSDRAEISHRFESLLLDARGRLHLVWVDKRDQAAAHKRGAEYAGGALYYAVSADGRRIGENRKLVDHSCECCRIGMALDTDGAPVIAWRHIFGKNVRDHALQRLDGRSALIRVAHDEWAIEACPHHGPAFAVGADGTYHVAWFTNGERRQGLFYARAVDRKTFAEPTAVGNPEVQRGHPTLLLQGPRVYLAWKEFDGVHTSVRLMHSTDGGAHWSAPRVLARTAGGSDYPLLVSDGGGVYLSWNAQQEGYRLIAVDGGKDGA